MEQQLPDMPVEPPAGATATNYDGVYYMPADTSHYHGDGRSTIVPRHSPMGGFPGYDVEAPGPVVVGAVVDTRVFVVDMRRVRDEGYFLPDPGDGCAHPVERRLAALKHLAGLTPEGSDEASPL